MDKCLYGYIKDSAWAYENELRIVSTEEKIDISSIIDSFEIISSPNTSLDECKKNFDSLRGNVQLKAEPKFIKNKFEGCVIKH